MKNVTLALDPLDPESWTSHEVDDLCAFLMSTFDVWPDTAKIYHQHVDESHNVTPFDEVTANRLSDLPGPFIVIVYPAGPVALIVALIVVVIAAAVLLRPAIPSGSLRNTQNQSPNNGLSDRTNSPRPLARIPDIYGTVRSTPDLIAVPYRIFIDHQEVEYCYMCIGRGSFQVSDVRDDKTLVSVIAGTSVEVYGPNTSPNSGDAPQLSIGTTINTIVRNVSRSNAVNGQVLKAPNSQKVTGTGNIYFQTPNLVKLNDGSVDFTTKFLAGDTLNISNSGVSNSFVNDVRVLHFFNDGSFRFSIPSTVLPSTYVVGETIKLTGALVNITDTDSMYVISYDMNGTYTIGSVSLDTEAGPLYYCHVTLLGAALINPIWDFVINDSSVEAGVQLPDGNELYNLNGAYTITSVTSDTITLTSPALVNANWGTITSTPPGDSIIFTLNEYWIGPFNLDRTDTTTIMSNFVALNGLYKDSGQNQLAVDIQVQLEITPINADGSPRGAVQIVNTTVAGSSTVKSTRAATSITTVTLPGRVKVRAKRVTTKDLDFKGNIIDEIKWRDVYDMSPITATNFGAVTTVQAVTYGTDGALAVKDRKLNMLVTRTLPQRISGSTFTAGLFATNSADDIISAICLDRYIGNRSLSEVDFNSIYSAIDDVKAYFGSVLPAEFCYTFDSDNLSFEEIVQAVADATFCTAYRRGNVIKLNFEKLNEESTLLFNHRNKLPGSELRTVRFGNDKNYDGVTLKYVSPIDDAVVNYYIPADRSAANPEQIETIGIRNGLQAYLRAWRTWNKIQYQNTISEFTATQEADLLVVNDRVLVADNTRTGTQDGEVLNQNVLELTLSQPVELSVGVDYNIFLQHVDGTVESIGVAEGSDDYHVILAHAPRLALALEDKLYARASYIIAGSDALRSSAFLVSKKEPKGNFTSAIQAVNYDARYYAHDLDYINVVVNADGVTL